MANFIRVGRNLVNTDAICHVRVPKECTVKNECESVQILYMGGHTETITCDQGCCDLLNALDYFKDESPKQQTPGGQYA